MPATKLKQKPCQAPGCDKTFIQYDSFTKHCSSRCKREYRPVKALKTLTQLKSKRRAIKAKSRPRPTVEQKTIHDRLRAMGCCVGRFIYGKPSTDPDIHHITVSGRRLGHQYVIPLHPIIHRQGTAEWPSVHSVNGGHGGKKAFKEAYGVDEFDLLAMCEKELGIEYSKVAA